MGDKTDIAEKLKSKRKAADSSNIVSSQEQSVGKGKKAEENLNSQKVTKLLKKNSKDGSQLGETEAENKVESIKLEEGNKMKMSNKAQMVKRLGTTSVVSSRTKRSSKPEKDSLRKVKKKIVKKKIISKSAVKLETVHQTKGVQLKSEENATKESDVTHSVVSKKKILMQKKSKLKKQASSVESGTSAK